MDGGAPPRGRAAAAPPFSLGWAANHTSLSRPAIDGSGGARFTRELGALESARESNETGGIGERNDRNVARRADREPPPSSENAVRQRWHRACSDRPSCGRGSGAGGADDEEASRRDRQRDGGAQVSRAADRGR